MDIELVVVGGSESDPLTALVKKRLEHFSYRTPLGEMPYFYNAADVFAWYEESDASLYAGTDISPLEAFACGVPVVSNTLVDLRNAVPPDIGCIPSNREEVSQDIQQMIEVGKRDTIRKYAERNFDWASISHETMSDYESILA
jgi:glycosyltransferase involved in cell wall biosynthesis